MVSFFLTHVLIRVIIYTGGEAVTYGELKRKLKSLGCYKALEDTRHEMWYSPITGKTFPVGRHNSQEVASGTLKSIKRDWGSNNAPSLLTYLKRRLFYGKICIPGSVYSRG